MGEEKKEQGKKCFIITPIGDTASETFRMAKGVIESVIKPLLREYGYDDIAPAYEINQTGMITTQIINRIIDDDLVVANLTGNNPNVMYELCLRHAAAKPIIHICQEGTNLPFDIKDSRTIFYKNDMLGAQELKKEMESFVQGIDYDREYIDNPIYNAQRVGKLLKEVPAESEKKVELELLQNILQEINSIKVRDADGLNISLKKSEPKKIFRVSLKGNVEDKSIDDIEHVINTKLLLHGIERFDLREKLSRTKYITYYVGNHSKDDILWFMNDLEEELSVEFNVIFTSGYKYR